MARRTGKRFFSYFGNAIFREYVAGVRKRAFTSENANDSVVRVRGEVSSVSGTPNTISVLSDRNAPTEIIIRRYLFIFQNHSFVCVCVKQNNTVVDGNSKRPYANRRNRLGELCVGPGALCTGVYVSRTKNPDGNRP